MNVYHECTINPTLEAEYLLVFLQCYLIWYYYKIVCYSLLKSRLKMKYERCSLFIHHRTFKYNLINALYFLSWIVMLFLSQAYLFVFIEEVTWLLAGGRCAWLFECHIQVHHMNIIKEKPYSKCVISIKWKRFCHIMEERERNQVRQREKDMYQIRQPSPWQRARELETLRSVG